MSSSALSDNSVSLTGVSSTAFGATAGGSSALVSTVSATLASTVSTSAGASTGVATASTGVGGGLFLTSFNRRASRFFSSVRRKTLIVVRRDLLGLQSSAATGVCSHTGQEEGRVDWPVTDMSNHDWQVKESKEKLTIFAYGLFAAREAERVHSQSTADGASKLDGDLILGERAV